MPVTKFKNMLYRFALPLLSPSSRASSYQTDGHPVTHLDQYKRIINRNHILGSACLLSNGEDTSMIFSSLDQPMHHADKDTFFRVASITKMAVALLSLKLCEEGLFSLDAPVSDYLPNANDISSLVGVTLRRILSHTSGLDDPEDLESALYKKQTFRDVLLRDGIRIHEPGTAFLYSNLAFGLIGSMVEYVTGKDVESVFREKLFQPLGMKATLDPTTLPYEKIMPISRVLPYHAGNDTVIIPLRRTPVTDPDPMHHFGYTAGGLYADVNSIRILLETITGRGKGYLNESLGNELCRQQSAYGTDCPGLDYGLGLFIISDPNLSEGRILGHQGFAYGCVDGAFVDENTGRLVVALNGGCSELRNGRLGVANEDILSWAFGKEIPSWRC